MPEDTGTMNAKFNFISQEIYGPKTLSRFEN
jgi:hypothetical protein